MVTGVRSQLRHDHSLPPIHQFQHRVTAANEHRLLFIPLPPGYPRLADECLFLLQRQVGLKLHQLLPTGFFYLRTRRVAQVFAKVPISGE